MLTQDIREAELVLVGIGNEMQVRLHTLKEIQNFAEKLSILEQRQDKEWLIPFLIRYYLKKEFHPEITEAYHKLKLLLEGKNYFIVSMSTDDLIRDAGFGENRVTLPCGTYELMQCMENCNGKLFSGTMLFGKRFVDGLKTKFHWRS